MSGTEESRNEIISEIELMNYLSDSNNNQSQLIADFVKLDLTGFERFFRNRNLKKSVFIDCKIPPEIKAQIVKDGAIDISNSGDVCFDIYPTNCYSLVTLYNGFDGTNTGLKNCFDGKVYDWFIENKKPKKLSPSQTIFARIHDTAMEKAIARLIKSHIANSGKLPIAIMGGHAKKRSDKSFLDVALLSRQLTRRGHLIVTGGGPGIMEAANLGAICAQLADEFLDEIVADLRKYDEYHNTIDWLNSAFGARVKIERALGKNIEKAASLSIPTWHYGHEPSNIFATHIAKFFFNSLREDGLVTIADGGIVFAEGNAGTVQEIFQDACQNYYRQDCEIPTPMVFFNSQNDYWTANTTNRDSKRKPLRPLIEQLAIEGGAEKEFVSALLFSDNIFEILEFFEDYHSQVQDSVSLGYYWRLAKNGHALGDPIK